MIHCASQSMPVIDLKTTGITALIALYNAALQNMVAQANDANEYLEPSSLKITLSVSGMGNITKPPGEANLDAGEKT